MASSEGRGGWVRVPSRNMSPYVRSAWINGTSSTLRLLCSSESNGPPSASSPETILSHASCGRCSWELLSGAITSWTKMSVDHNQSSKSLAHVEIARLPLLSPNRKSPRPASASFPVARFVICNAPEILTNLAGDPSGSRSFNLTFWWDVVCMAPKQPATHSRSIIQSLTYVYDALVRVESSIIASGLCVRPRPNEWMATLEQHSQHPTH